MLSSNTAFDHAVCLEQVGVVDILPSCLSSVYCFYDPEYRQLSLGKVTALWEIKWVQEALKYRPDLKYYYLGFYIHTCPKMRYKGSYEPSELLCPVTMRWVPLSVCRPILDRCRYARLAPSDEGPEGAGMVPAEVVHAAAATSQDHVDYDNDEEDEEEAEEEDEEQDKTPVSAAKPLGQAEILAIQQVVMDVGPLARLPKRSQHILLPILREFVEHVGTCVASRLMIKLRH